MMENSKQMEGRASSLPDLLIDKKTGLIISEDSDPKEIARVLRQITMDIKRLENFRQKLTKIAMGKVQDGDDLFGDYFEIVAIPPRINEREDLKLLTPTQRKAYLEAKDKFELFKNSVFSVILRKKDYTKYLKMPKYDHEI